MKRAIFLAAYFIFLVISSSAQSTTESDRLFPVQVKGRFGYIDARGAMVIKPQFDSAGAFHDGLALVQVNGKNISQTEGRYDYIGGDYGYIDKSGKFVIEPGKYKLAKDFSEGLASVWIDSPAKTNGYGYIDTTGKIVIKGQFKTAGDFNGGTADVRLANDKWGVIDKNAAFVVPPIYDGALPFIEGVGIGILNVNKKSSPFGQKLTDFESVIYDRNGKITARLSYPVFGWFSDGLAPIADENKKAMGFIDKAGNIVIEPRFEKALGFSEGLCPVRENRKWGYIDKTGSFVITPQFDDAFVFAEGLARVVTDGGKTGFIDKTGKLVIEPQTWEVGDFEDGLAYVRQNDERGLIDKTGRFIWKTKE